VRSPLSILIVITALAAGCGTTRWSDTSRTATEQLLLSDAIDRAVSNFDLRALAGKEIYFDTSYLKSSGDVDYLIGSLRQHALASGCILREKAEEADYVVEIRNGSLGTDRHDLLFGVPATTIPASTFTAGVSAQIPELPLMKRTEQRAVAKIALFAYNRETGRPVWQSGTVPVESAARAFWVLGAGPFHHGHIYQGTDFAGEKMRLPLVAKNEKEEVLSVATEAHFTEPPRPADTAESQTPSRQTDELREQNSPTTAAQTALPPGWETYPQTQTPLFATPNAADGALR
jgi:hypothetical protein